MGAWNGLALQTEFSETLGDTSTGFKARVLKWMNDIQDDICSRHKWPFLHRMGQKALVSGTEFQNLNVAADGAPNIAAQNGGSLTSGSSYRVAVTFVCSSNGYETEAGTASASAGVSGASLQLAVTALPVSAEVLVTSRNIYLSKDGADYFFYAAVGNNTATTTTITADTTSTITPPDYAGIQMIIDKPWIESTGTPLEQRPEAQLRLIFPNTFQTGTPQFFDSLTNTKIILYPTPSTALQMKYNYIKIPARIFADSTVSMDLPIWMKNILEAGVLAKGYQYRERPLAATYIQLYESRLASAISERSASRYGPARIRDVTGDSDGYVY